MPHDQGVSRERDLLSIDGHHRCTDMLGNTTGLRVVTRVERGSHPRDVYHDRHDP